MNLKRKLGLFVNHTISLNQIKRDKNKITTNKRTYFDRSENSVPQKEVTERFRLYFHLFWFKLQKYGTKKIIKSRFQ